MTDNLLVDIQNVSKVIVAIFVFKGCICHTDLELPWIHSLCERINTFSSERTQAFINPLSEGTEPRVDSCWLKPLLVARSASHELLFKDVLP